MLSVLYSLIITPIELIVEMTYSIMFRIINNQGLAIVAVSVVIQSLILPLYRKSDKLQEEERNKQANMSYWVNHIRKTFTGDERLMLLSTYYRQQNYKPYYALKSSISILLQIPFFIAAYHFLSNLSALDRSSFFIIRDLGKPDQLFFACGYGINLLPILMTVINIFSGVIYTKGFPLKNKIQVYGLALVFLVVLYNSPSGLVLYWIMNNVYSLVKNIIVRCHKHPMRVISIGMVGAGVCCLIWGRYSGKVSISKVVIILIICFLILIILFGLKKRYSTYIDKLEKRQLFFYEAIFLTLFFGVFISTDVIKASTSEFISVTYGPAEIIIRNICVFAGVFLIWATIFYFLMPLKARYVSEAVLFGCSGAIVLNYVGFGGKRGTMSALLQYAEFPQFTKTECAINLFIVLAFVCIMIWLFLKHTLCAKRIICILCISIAVISSVNLNIIFRQFKINAEIQRDLANREEKIIHLSKNGKNVIVLMLDRAINGYIPYIFEEKPDLKQSFEGFTYYPNTLSYGGHTNFASPALFGGYEYTPSEINKRENESIPDKHNEAIQVMPAIFSEQGYRITVCDPPYAGYSWLPDLSMYDKYEETEAYITAGAYSKSMAYLYEPSQRKKQESNLIYYSLMKSAPLVWQKAIYADGNYLSTTKDAVDQNFISVYSVLTSLLGITDITEEDKDNFLMFTNDTTHYPTLLKLPEYIPEEGISKAVYADSGDASKQERREINGCVLKNETLYQLAHYQVNMASLMALGQWFDYLKEMGCYDNTRIIIVSDHGFALGQFDYMLLDNGVDVERYNPLLLVKDFNTTGFSVSENFMTNADVPSIAFKNVIEEPINPFTGKEINEEEKYNSPQLITTSGLYNMYTNRGNVFDTSDGEWFAVSENIFDVKNWKLVE